jgi:hypothetical protein
MRRALRVKGIVSLLALVLTVCSQSHASEAIEVIAAARTFTIVSGSSSIQDGDARVIAGTSQQFNGYVEFDLPRRATNMQALLTFGGNPRPRIELFAYAAGPTDGLTIAELPRELIGAVTTNSVQEFDLTPCFMRGAKRPRVFGLIQKRGSPKFPRSCACRS